MKVLHANHIGINVTDLPAAQAFFTDLGFIVEGEAAMEGEFLDKVIGLKGAQTDFVMLQAPDGQLNIEIIKYNQPLDPEGSQKPAANKLGLGHIALEVDNVDEIVTAIKAKGYDLVGEVQTYQRVWKLCYVRGPEGIIVELAERL